MDSVVQNFDPTQQLLHCSPTIIRWVKVAFVKKAAIQSSSNNCRKYS